MKTVIATTTRFHLQRLASEFSSLHEDISYFSYTPRFRMQRDGLDAAWAQSLFMPLLPISAFALMRSLPWQMQAVESMLMRTDDYLARHLPPCDIFIGLSSMAVRSAARARELGATVIIERGSRHVLSQTRLISVDGGKPLSPVYIARELDSYAQADIITVPSEHAAESFIEEGFPRERIFVCPLGVDLRRFIPTPRPAGPLRLLFVGGWSHQKGVDLLVKAIAQRPEWRLTHVGMQAGANFPHITSQIVSLGYRNHTQLAQIMAEHHILVLPSRQDGFGRVLLEALAAGLPVVASRMTGGPDIRAVLENPDWVEIVEPGDADDLLRGLDNMVTREKNIQTSEPRHRLTENDQKFFSWHSYARRYLAFLKQLYAGKGKKS